MSAIRPLSPSTRASLQSSLIAVTLDDVCAVLLRHALEYMGASTRKPVVSVSMDYDTWTLTVKHNGGATNAELDMLSYLGMLHSRVCSEESDTTRIVQNGQVIYSGLSPDPDRYEVLRGPMRLLEDGKGAVICLRDIFHSMPVRRSFLEADTQKRKQNERLMETVRKLSLLRPDTSFRLMVLSEYRQPKPLLTLAQATDLVERFRQAYGRSSLDMKSMRAIEWETILRGAARQTEVRNRSVKLQLRGFVSLSTSSKAPQILLVNGYNWSDLGNSNLLQVSASDNERVTPYLDIYGEVSSAGRVRTDLYSSIENKINGLPNAATTTKGSQHAFVIIATLKDATRDALQRGSRQGTSFETAVLDSISASEPKLGSSYRKEVDNQDTISTSASYLASVEYVGRKRPKTAPSGFVIVPSVSAKRPQTASLETPRHACSSIPPPTGMTRWIDPQTEEHFFIDTQTGQSFGPIDRAADHSDLLKRKIKAGIIDRSKLRKRSTDNGRQAVPQWLESTLKDWKNPAFSGEQASPVQLPSLSSEFDDPELDAALAALPSTPRRSKRLIPAPHRSSRFFGEREAQITHDGLEADNTRDPAESTAIETVTELHISRTDLATVHVVNQVDDKFVLCTLTPQGSHSAVLVCFDQHAVDERYRLEQLLQDYVATCHRPRTVGSTSATPFTVNIDREEYALLADKDASSTAAVVQASLAFLGFSVAGVVLVHEGLGHAQADLTSIPDVLRDRVVSLTGRVRNADLLSHVFRATLAELMAQPIPPAVLERDELCTDPLSWLTTTRHIPPSLMELFCSKACRSAIMFNDPLSKAACQTLMSRLALCQFPFQCAHGRPTIVPLCRF
nr:mismatch repair and meiotic recombination protein [Farysia itapuensis]